MNSPETIPVLIAENVPSPRSIRQARTSIFFGKCLFFLAIVFIGALIGRWGGAIVALLIASIYLWMSSAESGRYPLDLHDGQVIDGTRAPETSKFTAELAEFLGIEAPAIYYIDVESPQVCVCATGYGKRVRGRIGLTKALLQEAEAGKLRVLLTMAVARIWCGHASVAGSAATFAGLFYQFAQSDGVNSFPTQKSRDPETELSPLGGFLITLWNPIAGLILRNCCADQLVLDADLAANNLGAYSYRAEYFDYALTWLAAKQFPHAQHPIATYNPAESLLYLVPPFEMDNARKIESDNSKPKPWQNGLAKITELVPDVATRVAKLKEAQRAVPAATSIKSVINDMR